MAQNGMREFFTIDEEYFFFGGGILLHLRSPLPFVASTCDSSNGAAAATRYIMPTASNLQSEWQVPAGYLLIEDSGA